MQTGFERLLEPRLFWGGEAGGQVFCTLTNNTGRRWVSL